MSKFLKGNYELKVAIDEKRAAEAERTVEEFERKALSRLGGSICFVSKKGFLWKGEDRKADGSRKADR
jgi:hypothetical protein